MKKIKFSDVLLILILAAAVLLEAGKIKFSDDEVLDTIIFMTISRTLAALFFLILIKQNNLKVFSKPSLRNLIKVLPCLLIVLCNMPVVQLITGECSVNANAFTIFLFAIECLAIGAFEELAFRGLFLPLALKKYGNSKKSILFCIILTSIIFGCYHIVNLFAGASFGATVLQIGYSALVGAMCGAVVLICGNVLIPVILHGTYNFAGMLVDTLGNGIQWDVTRIIIFAIVSAFVLLYIVGLFVKSEKFALTDKL